MVTFMIPKITSASSGMVTTKISAAVTFTVKAMIMNVDGEPVVFFIKGDRELNESKALKLLNASEINFADDELIAGTNVVAG